MSRSRKKNPVIGMTDDRSEKADKRIANQTYRSHERDVLMSGDEVFPVIREVSNSWCFAKDGKHRFCPKRHPKLMRK